MSVDPIFTDAGCDNEALNSAVGVLRTQQAQPHRSMQHILWEAIKDYAERAAERAATSSAGDLAATLEAVLAEHDADRADEAANAVDQGERPDLWEDEITIATHLIREAAQALRHQSTGVTEIRELLQFAVDRLEDIEDEGPTGEGWQSEKLLAWIERSRALTAALSAQERG